MSAFQWNFTNLAQTDKLSYINLIWIHKNTEVAQQLLDKYKNQMASAGVAVQLKSQPRMLGIAKDVLQASTTGRFDALIMGRRGLSGLQDMFIGSVSANSVNNSEDTPVWLVEEEGSSQNITVASPGIKHDRLSDFIIFHDSNQH